MKKLFLFTVVCLSLLMVFSCSNKKELKQTKGVVTSFFSIKDSLVTVRLAVESDTLLFKLADARLVNGMFIKGDSVTIDYIEEESDTLRAFVVTVMPKPVHYIDLDSNEAKSDTLVTRSEEVEDSVQLKINNDL